MNLLTRIALAVIGTAVVVMAVGGFVVWDWNPANWSMDGRIAAVVVWIASIPMAVILIVDDKP